MSFYTDQLSFGFLCFVISQLQISGKRHQLTYSQHRTEFVSLHYIARSFTEFLQIAFFAIDQNVSRYIWTSKCGNPFNINNLDPQIYYLNPVLPKSSENVHQRTLSSA